MSVFNTLVPSNPTKNVVFGSVISTSISTNGSFTLGSASITLSGTKPVLITLRPYLPDVLGGFSGSLGFDSSSAATAQMNLIITCSSGLSAFSAGIQMNFGTTAPRYQRYPPEAFWWLDTNPVAGTFTYTLSVGNFNANFSANSVQLVVEEVN